MAFRLFPLAIGIGDPEQETEGPTVVVILGGLCSHQWR